MKICEQADPKAFQDWTFPDILEGKIRLHTIQSSLYSMVNELEKNKNTALSHNVNLIAHIVGMGLDRSNYENPFKPIAILVDGSRTAAIEDFTDTHIAVIEEVLKQIKNPFLKGRLLDFLWVKKRPRNISHAEEAIHEYLTQVRIIREKDGQQTDVARGSIERAIQIWRMTSSNSDTKKHIIREIKSCLDLKQPEPNNMIRVLYYELIPKCLDDSDDIKEWLKIGKDGMNAAIKQDNFEKARFYSRVRQELFRVFKNENKLSEEKRSESGLYVAEAYAMKDAGSSAIILQALFNKAIVACREVGEKGKAKTLQMELNELQKDILNECKRISTPLDLTTVVNTFLNKLRERNLDEGLKLIATKAIPTNKSDLLDKAKKMIRDCPLQSTFTTIITDEKGKIVDRQPGISDNPNESQAMLRSKAAGLMKVTFQITGMTIESGRCELYNLFFPTSYDFFKYLYPNVFVPSNHLIQYQTGLRAGLNGDWIASTAILVPLLENSLRAIMQMAGHNMVTLDSENIQKEKDLNAFIYTEEFCTIVGEDMQFQLQVLFTDRGGINLRNNLAHGLLTDTTIFSGIGPFVWALTLLLVFEFQRNISVMEKKG